MMTARVGWVLVGSVLGWVSMGLASPWKTETWPSVRTLTWAGGSGDWTDLSKWKEGGKAAATLPDQETDVVIPKGSAVRMTTNQSVRHLKVEDDAEVRSNWDNYLYVWGNVDLGKGARAYQLAFRGPKNTYLNAPHSTLPPVPGRSSGEIAHKLQIQKYGGASVEFIGKFHVTDEVLVQSGRLILNGTLIYVSTTKKGAFEIFDGATVELRDGALLSPGRHDNSKNAFHLSVYRNGSLLAGSPDRPLERDATIALGINSNEQPGMSGLYAAEGSFVRVFTRDPARARLVFTAVGAIPGLANGKGESLEQKDAAARGATGIYLQIGGVFPEEGVHFEYVGEGGLGLADPKVAANWRNTFGSKNASSDRSKLVAAMAVRPDQYVTERWFPDDYKETTQVAMEDYEAFLAENDPYRLSAEPPATERRKDKDGLVKPMTIEYQGQVRVELKSELAGSEIWFTLDGTDPVKGGRGVTRATGPIELRETTRIRARAYHPSHEPGPEFSATYIIR